MARPVGVAERRAGSAARASFIGRAARRAGRRRLRLPPPRADRAPPRALRRWRLARILAAAGPPGLLRAGGAASARKPGRGGRPSSRAPGARLAAALPHLADRLAGTHRGGGGDSAAARRIGAHARHLVFGIRGAGRLRVLGPGAARGVASPNGDVARGAPRRAAQQGGGRCHGAHAPVAAAFGA